MKILYSWLKDFVELRESPEKLAELLSFSSFETQIDKAVKGDAVLEIALLPNRIADAASHLGIAREAALILQRKIKSSVKEPREISEYTKNFMSLEISSPKVRRYSARVMRDVKIKESPWWMQDRLKACGFRPINNIVDATNYVMLELGQPLHAFDADEIKDQKIIVRQAEKGEEIETIERKKYKLDGSEVLIADPNGPLALAGIKGGSRGEISAHTNNIILESANFDPVVTRKTSRKLALKTDASWRFENDLDPNLTEIALNRVAELIKEIDGGEILKGIVDHYPKKVLPWPIEIEAGKISKVLGISISEREIISLVNPFCEQIKKQGKDKLLLHIKTFRRDLKYPEDIAEEVGRLIGYNKIKSYPPHAVVHVPPHNEMLEFHDLLRNFLAGLGSSEVYNYSFISERDAEVLDLDKTHLIEIQNPISEEGRYLRPSAMPGILKNVRDNLRFFDEVHVFEIGKRYYWEGPPAQAGRKPEERWIVAGALSRNKAKASDLFFEVKGTTEALLEELGLDSDDYRFKESEMSNLKPDATASILVEGSQIGFLGLVGDKARAVYDIDPEVAWWHFDIEKLMQVVEEEHEFMPLQKYPDIIRDIAILVPADMKIEEVQNIINAASPKYLEDLDLFDIFESSELGEAKKSLAFHLIFRAEDRTLTDEEVGKEIEKIVSALRAEGAEIR